MRLSKQELFINKQRTSNQSGGGFTLIEILVVLALITAIASLGVTAGIDSYQRFLFRSNVDTATSLLQKARSSAIHNIGETNHGVDFDHVPEKFVLFRGSSYLTRDSSFDLLVDRNKAITPSGLSEVVFEQLSGETADGDIVLTDGVRTTTIEINHEGGIN